MLSAESNNAGFPYGASFFVDYNPSFAGSIPSEIGNLSLLEFYSTTGNFHTGEIPTEFGLLTNLVALSAGKFTVVEARIP